MAQASRTAQFARLHKILKKHYKPRGPDPKRPVLEHLLFACVLENARYEPAEEAFAALVHGFFDWNEVRVTSIRELCEVLSGLPDPRAAANRIKRVLHAVFEASYSFDLEERRKQNLGPTIKWLEKLDGATPFAVNYVVQSALGGHAIPLDRGTLDVLRLVDLITDEDLAAGTVSGLDRAVSKAKGVEYGSLLHQLGADFTANPFSPPLREILLEINPEVKSRLPKRRSPKPAEAEEPQRPTTTVTPTAPSGPPVEAPPTEETKKSRKRRKSQPDEPADAAAPSEPSAAAEEPSKRKPSERRRAPDAKEASVPDSPELPPKQKKRAADGGAKPKPR